MSDTFINAVDATKAVGKAGDQPLRFDDLVAAGGWPSEQNIQSIQKITVYVDNDKWPGNDPSFRVVVGLEITYRLVAGTKVFTHGLRSEESHTVNFTKDQVLVGCYGFNNVYKNRVGQINLAVFDASTSQLVPKGPFGTTDKDELSTPWATFGSVLGFNGNTQDGVGLTALAFYKVTGIIEELGIF